MDIMKKRIPFDTIGRPLIRGLRRWIAEHGLQLPCLLVDESLDRHDPLISSVTAMGKNMVSAVPAPVHPYLFAKKDKRTEDISFPFREKIGVGKRRQDLDPVFLYVPKFALICDMESPFIPFLITNGRRKNTSAFQTEH
jgi:hypothetical protein